MAGTEVADGDAVRRVLEGEVELYTLLVDRYRTRLYRFVERYTNDPEDARDVTQEVFLKVYGALDTYDSRYKFSTWLFRIAGNAAIDHLRRRRLGDLPRGFEDDEEGAPSIRATNGPIPWKTSPARLRKALDEAIERLPDDYRELIACVTTASYPMRSRPSRECRSEPSEQAFFAPGRL
jgi:RNA polymerase sigma-70 factor (ECF subfamily)